MLENEWIMYAVEAEIWDDSVRPGARQGWWLKADGEEPPDIGEDPEEFDDILDPDEAGFYIQDIATGNQAIRLAGRQGKVVEVIFI